VDAVTRQRDRRGAWIHRGRWTAEIHGPARVVVPAVRAVCGDRWSWDSSAHCLRVPIVFADDLEAALNIGRALPTGKRKPAEVGQPLPGVLW
jgi:hypothetical protein